MSKLQYELLHPQSYNTSLKHVIKDCLGVSSDQSLQEHQTSISKKCLKNK